MKRSKRYVTKAAAARLAGKHPSSYGRRLARLDTQHGGILIPDPRGGKRIVVDLGRLRDLQTDPDIVHVDHGAVWEIEWKVDALKKKLGAMGARVRAVETENASLRDRVDRLENQA